MSCSIMADYTEQSYNHYYWGNDHMSSGSLAAACVVWNSLRSSVMKTQLTQITHLRGFFMFLYTEQFCQRTHYWVFKSWAKGDDTGIQIRKSHLNENSNLQPSSELFRLHIKFTLSSCRDQGNSFRCETVLTFWHSSARPHFKNAAVS